MSSIAYVAEWALRSSLLILGGAELLRVSRVNDSSLRFASWTALLFGSLLIPAMGPVLPAMPSRAVRSAVSLAESTARIAEPGAFEQAALTSLPAVRPTPSTMAPMPLFDWGRAVLGLYVFVALILLLRLALGLAISRRLLRSSDPAGKPGVRESRGVAVPVTLGIVRPVVVLPVDWRGWGETRLAAVLAHERSHIRRRDPALQLISAIHRALLWFSPLSWLLHKELVRVAEDVSDEAAVAVTGDSALYAEVLLDFIRRATPHNRLAGISMARYGSPEKRIDRILEAMPVSRKLNGRGLTAVLLLAAPLAYLSASVRPSDLPDIPPRAVDRVRRVIGPVLPAASATPDEVRLLAQGAPPSRPPAPALPPSPPPAPRPQFDVASIRPCVNGDGAGGGGRGSDRAGTGSAPARPPAASSGGFTVSCVAVSGLINMAYVRFAEHFDPNSPVTITGGPDWIKPGLGPNFSPSDRYTIQAEAAGNPSQEIMHGPMLQSLLEDRFKLKLHRETKDVPAYALTVAKGKAKLKPYDSQCFNVDFTKFPLKGPDAPNQPPCEHGAGRKGSDIAVALQADSLSSFAGVLGSLIGRPIVDKTGISGLFDFELEYGPDENSPQSFATDFCAAKPMLPICKTDTGTASDPAGPSIFTVLEKQFGLKLEPTTGSKEFLIIDHIERPTEN